MPCPHCGQFQWLKFERLRWEKGRPEAAEYHCEGCERGIAEHHKTALLEAGVWRATAIAADPGTVGYHLYALYSPLILFPQMVLDHEKGNQLLWSMFKRSNFHQYWQAEFFACGRKIAQMRTD